VSKRGLTLLPFVAFVLVMFIPFWWQHRFFIPEDFLQFIFPWRTSTAPGPIPVHNIELFDVATLFYPQDVFVNAQLKLGHIPLWNPHIFLGHPICASGQSALWYPPRLVLQWLFKPAVARTLSLMGHLLLAGCLFALWLRDRGYSRAAACGGGLAYMLNGQMASWFEYEHIVAIGCWLGLQFWLIDRAVGLPAARSGLRLSPARGWALLALVWGMSLQAGHLQLGLHYGIVVGLYAAYRVLPFRRQWLWLLAALGATFALAAPTILPFLELLHNSQRLPLDPYKSCASLSSLLGGMLCPDLFGDPTRGFLFNRCVSNLVFPEFACFIGLVGLLAALTTLRTRRVRGLRGEWLLWAGLGIVSLLWSSASPLYSLLVLLVPGLKILIPGRALLMVAPGLSVLACEGFEQLEQGRGWRLLAGLAGATLMGWVGVEFWAFQTSSHWTALWHGWLDAHELKLPPPDLGPAYARQCFQQSYLGNPQFHLPLLLCLLTLVCTRLRPRRAVLVLVLVSSLDLGYFIIQFNPTVTAAQLAPTAPEINYLQSQTEAFRVETLGCAYYNTLTPYGIDLMTGYESVFPVRLQSTLQACDPTHQLSMRSAAPKTLSHPLLSSMNLRYLLTSPLEKAPGPPWREAFHSTSTVWENPNWRPRAFWCAHPVTVANLDQALARIRANNTTAEVLVESDRPVPSGVGEARLLGEQPDRIVVGYSAASAGVVVLSESYDPGWHASLNGQPLPILPANGCLMGVVAPPGSGEIQFRYQPRSLTQGFELAGLASLLCLLLLCVG
jgi:hypothetical protein